MKHGSGEVKCFIAFNITNHSSGGGGGKKMLESKKKPKITKIGSSSEINVEH